MAEGRPTRRVACIRPSPAGTGAPCSSDTHRRPRRPPGHGLSRRPGNASGPAGWARRR